MLIQIPNTCEGLFMGKLGKKHGNVTPGGTVLHDGMRLWVDTRKIKYLTIRTGDKCKFFLTITFIISDASRI